MVMAAWILFFMFASIGLVQCGFWLAEALVGHGARESVYYVVPVYDDPEGIEARVRLTLSRIRKHRGPSETVLLVDMGLGVESRQICDKLILEDSGAYICEKGLLPAAIAEFEAGRQAEPAPTDTAAG